MSNKYQNSNLVIKNGIYLFLRLLLVLFLGFFTTRLTLQVLGDEKFGIYNIVGGIIAIFAIISMPVRDSIQRFFNVEFSQEKCTPGIVFHTSIRLIWAMVLLITILYETIGIFLINYIIVYPEEETLAVNVIFQLSVLSNLFGFIALPHVALLFARENMGIPALCEIITAFIKIGLLYFIPLVPVDVLIPYAAIFLLINVGLFVFYHIYCHNKYPECFDNNNIDRTLKRNMLGFSGWTFLESVAGIALTYLSNVFINIFGGVLYNTAYGISKQLQNAVVSFASNVLKASDPQITSSTATNNFSYRDQLVMTTAKISFLGVSFAYIIFHFDGAFLLDLWLDVVPQYAFSFCDLTLLATVFASISLPFRTLIMATGKIKGYFITYGIVSLLSMVLMYIVLNLNYPILSVMYIITISSVLMFVASVLFSSHLAGLRIMFVVKNLLLSLLTLIIVGIVYLLSKSIVRSEFLGIGFAIILSTTALIIVGYMLAFNETEKIKFKQIVSKLKINK